MLRDWDDLPRYMKTEAVRPYYDRLKKKRISLLLKRGFDIVVSALMLVVLSPVFIIISIMIAGFLSTGANYAIREKIPDT